jgi:D-alanine-D-alanine ligase
MSAARDPARFGRVAVVMGGTSAEREVSLDGGRDVLAALQASGVDAQAVDGAPALLRRIESGHFDRVFIMLHGRGGEDGSLQGALDLLGVPYTGSGVLGSALAMDKVRTKQLWQAVGVPTAEFRSVSEDTSAEALAADIGLPLVVKPVHEGSTVGISRARTLEELRAGLAEARRHDRAVMVERLISGGEYTVGILGREALPIIRVVPPGGFYDYHAKYHSDQTEYRIPSGLEPAVEAELRRLALLAFDAVGAHGWGRVDFMMDAEGNPRFLEVNTVPGMTSHSLVPKAAAAIGIDFAALVLRILETSLGEGAE